MKENGLGTLFVRHLVMAIPWGIMLLVVFFIAEASLKQQIKEGIEYGIVKAANETTRLAFSNDVVIKAKQNVKEGVEFIAQTGRNEIKAFLKDPEVKEQIKKGMQYAMKEALIGATDLAFDYNVVTKVKKNVKEGVEFVARTGKKEMMAFLNDPEVKEEIKKGMQYAMNEALIGATDLAFDYNVVTKFKKNVKEGVEFVARTERNEIRNLLNDPQVKQDLKEVLAYGGHK